MEQQGDFLLEGGVLLPNIWFVFIPLFLNSFWHRVFILEYKVDLEFNELETEEENLEEEKMVLPGTLSVEDIR